ncbi:MAG: hypothetical protein KAU58_04050 [Candidatus Omnitrophica bacterium]|nr:hypothetical protein [Candidatus Omnitrophota bacterium]
MGILQSVGKGFSESSKLLKIVLILFIFNFAMGLLALPFTGPQNVGKPQAAAMTILISLISILIFIFLQGGALGLIRDLLKKNSFSLSDFVANGKKYYLRILGLFLTILAIALVAIIILALLSSGILAIANNAFTRSLITAVIVVLSLIVIVLFLFPIYIIVLEEKGPIEAIKRGIRVSLDNFWKTLGLFLLLLIIAFGLAFIIGILTALISGALPITVGQVIMLFTNGVLQSYLSIVMMIAFMTFYLGLSKQQSTPEGPTQT